MCDIFYVAFNLRINKDIRNNIKINIKITIIIMVWITIVKWMINSKFSAVYRFFLFRVAYPVISKVWKLSQLEK